MGYIETVNEDFNLYISPNQKVIKDIRKGKIITDICTVCHCDVVPGPEKMFKVTFDEEKIYGRGVLDMKGALSVCISSWIKNSGALINSKNRLLFIITTDEETGSKNGIQYITKNYSINNSLTFIPDTGEGVNKILAKGKGALFFDIISHGNSAHGCRPWLGNNAIDQGIDFYLKFIEFIKFLNHDRNPNSFNRISVNLGKINGGDAINKVPESAQLGIDCRFPPSKKILNSIKEFLNENENSKISFNIKESFSGFPRINITSIGEQYRESIKGVSGGVIEYEEYGGNDGRFFINNSKELLMTGPKGEGFHSNYEYVLRKEIDDFYLIYNNFIKLF